MTDMTQRALSDSVQISRQYQRSIRVDADIGRADALSGYICHATAAAVVDGMCRQVSGTNQRCFTWTGPFGGGKSSLFKALLGQVPHVGQISLEWPGEQPGSVG